MDDLKEFFHKHYVPNNAILVVAGNVTLDQVKSLSDMWFAQITSGNKTTRNLPVEPRQEKKRELEVNAKVPASAIYKCYHTCGRFDDQFHATDLMNDILGRGLSSRLYHTLVKERKKFASISSFTMGSIDPGLLILSGRVNDGVDLRDAEKSIDELVYRFVAQGPSEEELEKVKNQALTTLELDEVEVMNRAMNLAFGTLSGEANYINTESKKISGVTIEDVRHLANETFTEENSSVMYYNATG
jgi:zinc protease